MGNKRHSIEGEERIHKKHRHEHTAVRYVTSGERADTEILQASPESPPPEQPGTLPSNSVSNAKVEPQNNDPGEAANNLGKALNFPSHQHAHPLDSSSDRPYNGHPSTLPSLPLISDATAKVAFTHPGAAIGKSVAHSYDRLELLGDAYIEVIATRLIFPRFPHLPAGRLSQLRESLVKNETLAEYAIAYGFDKRAILPPNFRNQTAGKIWTKTIGDIFEAYVAGIIVDDPEQGFQRAEKWLCTLWENKLTRQPAGETQVVDMDMKMMLAKKINGKGIKPEYRVEDTKEIRKEGKLVYQIGIYFTGWGWENQFLGRGKGLSQKEAGAMAAKEALDNRVVEQISAVKKVFDEKVKAERAALEAKEAQIGEIGIKQDSS